jgi:hypothetical protein
LRKDFTNNLKRDRAIRVLGENCLETRGSGQGSFSGGIRVEPQQRTKPATAAKIDFKKGASSFSGELGEFRPASYARKHSKVPQAKFYGLSPEEALP